MSERIALIGVPTSAGAHHAGQDAPRPPCGRPGSSSA